MNMLEQLRAMTVVVADTGDFESMRAYLPRDATTNPSLISSAAQLPQYRGLVDEALREAKQSGETAAEIERECLEKLFVKFAREILAIIPGRVSVEVDASLSFDTQATIQKARRFIALFEKQGTGRERILIKIASTWEGIQAARQLEKEGIHCNLTLLFGFVQAVACAEAGVTLISPFVGRIHDWYKAQRGVDHIPAAEDPGVASVKRIYAYYKQYGYATEIMGASFRNTGEIVELAGCDLLTISPALLQELASSEGELERKLDSGQTGTCLDEKMTVDEKAFRWMLNEDAMATEKLAEGIRKFNADLMKLWKYVSTQKCH